MNSIILLSTSFIGFLISAYFIVNQKKKELVSVKAKTSKHIKK